MPAIAEKIYANLMKDPDLDIPNGLTREDVARTEAEQRERQYLNNEMALSLVKEELEKNIGNIMDLKGEPDYKLLPEHSLIYDNLSPEDNDFEVKVIDNIYDILENALVENFIEFNKNIL